MVTVYETAFVDFRLYDEYNNLPRIVHLTTVSDGTGEVSNSQCMAEQVMAEKVGLTEYFRS